jgi:hypothetical protein
MKPMMCPLSVLLITSVSKGRVRLSSPKALYLAVPQHGEAGAELRIFRVNAL